MTRVMKCRGVMLVLTCCFLIMLKAGNYPHRSDVLWVTTPSSSDWLYKTGEMATIDLQLFRYGLPQDGLEVSYELSNELMPIDRSGKVTLRDGRASISIGTMKSPGFRDCKLSVNIGGKSYKHHIKVGFSPDKLEPYTKMPDDFMEFWDMQRGELSKFPLRFSQQKIDRYSTNDIDCFLIKLDINNRGQAIYGYLFKPKAEGKYPVVLSPPGAGIKSIKDPMRRKYYPENGFIRFEIEIHGLNPEWSDEVFKEINSAFNARDNGYLVNGLDSRENYYMKRVYLGCLRAVDFLTSLPDWDGRNVAVQGGSQGGALAMVVAGLDSRVTACVANHPALSDMAGYKAERAGGYPHFFTKRVGMDTPEKIKTMAYYDVVNFARLIKAPTRLTWGFNDDVCPATTSYIVYNVLNCPKEALITPVNEHWTSEETEYSHMEWIKKQLK
ncbi:MAG: acetylxylan esterase [Bacteroidales bacterium]